MTNRKETVVFTWLDELPFNRFHASTLALCCLILAAAGYNLQVLAYAMPLILREWALTPIQGGMLISAGFLGLMAGALGFACIGDRLGRKKAIMAGILVFSLFSGGASIAPSYPSLCFLRFLTGVGIGGVFPLTVALLSEFSPSRIRARVVTAAVSGFTFGWVVAASSSMAVIPRYGWRPAFQLGLVPLALLPVLGMILPESIRFLTEKGLSRKALKETRRVEKIARLPARGWSQADFHFTAKESRGNVVELFRGGMTLMTLLAWSTYLLNTMTLYGLSSWLPALLVKEGFSLVKSYAFTMVQAGCSAAGGLLLGWLMDRFGRKHGLILIYLFGGFSVILFGSVSSNLYLFLAGAATGMFVVGTPTALNVVCSEIYPTGVRATGIASTQAMGRIGSILGPIFGGLLQTSGLGFQHFFILFSIPCFLCMFLVAFYPVNVKDEALERVREFFASSKSTRESGSP